MRYERDRRMWLEHHARDLHRFEAGDAQATRCWAALRLTVRRSPRPARLGRQLQFVQVADGIFIRSGVDEDATAANGDAIANVGFIVGRRSVATMDAGGSLEDGERLRAAIRKHTPLPISHVILSHAHPDHVFGAPAFARDKPQFVGHAKLPARLALRADYYRARLEAELGKARAAQRSRRRLLVESSAGHRARRPCAHPHRARDCPYRQ